jgi:two-component system, OmpR family, sensor histidine kinase TctE
MKFWPRSLQGQLALRLAAVFLVASAAGVGLLLWQGSESADSFGLEMLRYRADELARYIVPEPDGHAALMLPPDLARLYSGREGENLYAIRTGSGQMLANSKEMGDVVTHWKSPPDNFRLEEFGPRQADYYGLAAIEQTKAGPVTVAIAHSSDADAVAVAMLAFFARRIAWAIPLFALATLLIGVWSIRAGFRRVAAISRRAAEIDPRSAEVRLPLEGLPSELVPLVRAVNLAFDRLQEGFSIQRRFTANAAHELRTPLTMLTAGLDEVPANASFTKLRADVARMNRLVNQLLQVARLDAIPLEVDEPVDLARVAAQVVEYLAPWAIAQRRSVGLDAPERPVMVTGNAEEMSNAIRNLVENAVLHTPPGTEVTVSVSDEGAVTVTDRGPGVADEDRSRIFRRFWRGKTVVAPGAGLGLSIVAEIIRLHGGTVEVQEAPGGGAAFKLSFRRVQGLKQA